VNYISNCELIFAEFNKCERYDFWWRNIYRLHSAEQTYKVAQNANVTTQFSLMMEPLQ